MEFELLKKFGMTNTEIKVYLEVLKLGETKIGAVIKKTELHRGTVYNVLSKLIELGFISFINKKGERYYKISGEKIFEEILNEKEKELNQGKKEIKELIITNSKTENAHEPKIEVFFGVRTFKTLFLEVYNACEKNNCEYLFLGRGGEMQEAVGEGYYEYTQKLKKEQKIKCRVILSRETKNLSYHKYTVGNIRYIPTEVYSPINIWVYGNCVLLVLFRTTPLACIKIENKFVADGFRNFFERLWDSAKKQMRHKINLYNFIQTSTKSLDILGINCLFPVHEGRTKILELLRKNKKVRILFSNPESQEFKKRIKLEEPHVPSVKESRIFYEHKATLANLKDIGSRIKNKNCLEVRKFDKKPAYTIIIIDNKTILFNKYSTKKGEYGSEKMAQFLEKEENKKFESVKKIFEDCWQDSKPIAL